jgi:hypothetical protein
MRSRLIFIVLGSAALGGCAYGYGGYGSPYSGVSVGVSYGSGYGGYGYGYGGYGSGYGYGYGGYCSPYGGYGGYGGSRYGSRYGCIDPYWGWYGDYYYPGTGYYVYDRHRRPYRWNDRQRRYWSERRERAQAVTGQAGPQTQGESIRPNWEGFDRAREANRPQRSEQIGANPALRQQQIQRREQIQSRTESPRIERPARSVREGASERRAQRQAEREARRSTRSDDE